VWGSGDLAPPFLACALDWGEWSAWRTGRFTPGERAPGTHWIGGWVGSRAVLDAVEKRKISFLYQEQNPGHPTRSPSLCWLTILPYAAQPLLTVLLARVVSLQAPLLATTCLHVLLFDPEDVPSTCRWYSTGLHGIISQKILHFIITAVRTSYPTFIAVFWCSSFVLNFEMIT
jgi:hypothetical protein